MNVCMHVRKITILLIYMIQMTLIGTELHIMTWNIRRQGHEKVPEHLWFRRMPYVADCIVKNKPTIVGLQESVIEQINDIAPLLPTYKWIGKGRGSAWFGLAKNEYNPIFYDPSHVELLDHSTFQLNSPSLFRRKKEGLIPRICTWAKFLDKSSKVEFYVFNTHLDNNYHEARKNGLNAVLQEIKKRVPAGALYFLMGDFNTEITEDIAKIITHAQMVHGQDLAKKRSLAKVTHTSWRSGRSEYIDHIFVHLGNRPIQIKKYTVVQPDYPIEPSDHNPITMNVQL